MSNRPRSFPTLPIPKVGHERNPRIIAVAAIIALVAGLSLGFASTGVIENDHDRNIDIPNELTMELDLMVAYNDDDIFFRYQWDTDTPHFYHDYLVYEGASGCATATRRSAPIRTTRTRIGSRCWSTTAASTGSVSTAGT